MRWVPGMLLAGCVVSAIPAWASPSVDTADAVPEFDLRVFAEGLQSPDGLAFHPTSGELYVSEETAGRISVIRNGRAVPVIGPDITVHDDLPSWLVTPDRTKQDWLAGRLNSPEGLAFAPDGGLYVVEDTPRGRILQFHADAAGAYRTATVVAVPDLGEPIAWESVCFARDGRMFLAGSSHEAGSGLGSSCVLSRDAAGTWWLVDAGVLASFSSVTMSTEEDVLIVGDESVGGLTWWDALRQRELQTFERDLGAIEGLCNLPDGSLVVAQESTVRKDASPPGGRLVRVNPATGALATIAEGLGTVESVVCDPRSGRLYVSEDSTGRILCLTPRTAFGPRNTLLQVARRGGEAQRGLPPRQAPDFLKQFMKRVGVDLVDSGASPIGGTDADQAPHSLTLEDLGRHIPLVAGRVRVDEMPGVADPITEVNFINLFPNQVTRFDNRPVPSICLFAARHRSGRVQRSQSIAGLHARKLGPDGSTETLSSEALLMLPLTTCSAVENDNGVTVVMSFLGLNRFEDSFLTLNYGRRNEAFFATSGDKLAVVPASFADRQADGKEILNFAMTGIRPRRMEDATWLRLDAQPRWSLLSPSVDVWVSRWTLARMPDLVQQMRRFNSHLLDTILEGPEPERALATQQEGEKPESVQVDSEKPAVNDQADRKPIATQPPLASIRFPPPPESDEDRLLTNLILSRIVQAWGQHPVD